MIKVLQYQDGDAYKIEPIPEVFPEAADAQAKVNEIVKSDNVFAFSVFSEEKLSAIIGVTLVSHGVAELWTLLSADIHKNVVTTGKLARKIVNFYRDQLCLHRFQCVISEKLAIGPRWMEFLGFEKSGIAKQDPDGTNHFLYGKVF
jgi:hypothetical protein